MLQLKTSLRPLILLTILTLVRGLIYLSIFPPFFAPDEAAHFEAIRLIGQEKKWPTSEVYAVTPMHQEMDVIFEQFRIWSLAGLYSPTRNLGVTDNLFIHYYPTQIAGKAVVAGSYALLYHRAVAPVSAAVASFNLATQVYVLRFISVLLATLTVGVAWFTIRFAFPENKIFAWATSIFIVFWPMHSHVTASINSDAVVELIGAIFFLLLVITYYRGISFFRGVALIGLLALAVITKPTALFLVPTLVITLLLYISRKHEWSGMIKVLLITVFVIMVGLGSLFVYTNSKGGRDLLSLFTPNLYFPRWSENITIEALKLYIRSLNFAVLSFGGLFGWSNLHIPWSWVRVLAVFCFFIITGILIFVYKNVLQPADQESVKLHNFQKDILIIFFLAILLSIMGAMVPIVITQSPRWALHSRYYFPAIIPVALYFFIGVQQLVPHRFSRFVLPAWLVGWITYDTMVLLFVILPYLYS